MAHELPADHEKLCVETLELVPEGRGAVSPATGGVRVLHLGRVGFIGGAERVLLAFAVANAELAVETFLACPPGQLASEARRLGVTTKTIALSRMQITANPLRYVDYLRSWLVYSRRLVELCDELRIDIVHVHHPVTALYCSRLVSRGGLPLILHLHEGPPGKLLYRLALRRAASVASKIICVSSAGIELLRRSGVSLTNATIVHNGTSLPAQQGGTASRSDDEVRIAVIGQVEPRKGHNVLIEAIALVAPRIPQIRCSIVGDTPANGAQEYSEALKRQVTDLGIESIVRFEPFDINVVERMASFDIIVSSSTRLESLSMVMLEAMAQGCVVVCTDLGGIRDAVNDGVNGFLAEPSNPVALAESIRRAVDCDRRKIGAAAALTIKSRFSVESMREGIGSVYAEVRRCQVGED